MDNRDFHASFFGTIAVGDKVRSWDQPDCRTGPHAHGIIGTVLAIDVKSVPVQGNATIIDPATGQPTKEYFFDCPRYAIMVEKYFDESGEKDVEPHIVYPPMNGTKTWLGDICNGVEAYDKSSK